MLINLYCRVTFTNNIGLIFHLTSIQSFNMIALCFKLAAYHQTFQSKMLKLAMIMLLLTLLNLKTHVRASPLPAMPLESMAKSGETLSSTAHGAEHVADGARGK